MSRLKKIMAGRCEHCFLCTYARNHPQNLFGKVMHWHGTWCPFWKAWKEQYGNVQR